MKENKNLKTAFEILDYFSGNLIGSILFVEKGLLPLEEIDDIDILINESNKIGARKYLNDKGYKETELPYSRPAYAFREGSLIFKKKGEITIDLCIGDNKVFTLSELVEAKFKRGTIDDFTQLEKVMRESLKQLI